MHIPFDKFHALIESAPDAMVVVDRRGSIVIVNAQAERLFGYSRRELVGMELELLIPERFREAHRNHRGEYTAAPAVRPMGTALELYGVTKEGTEIPVEISLSPIQTEEGFLICSAIRDVSARKEVESKLKRSLKEKEVLLREVHHRVKNNLQTISSLLSIQSRYIEDETARAMFDETRWRVRSFALLHEKLYQSRDLSKIDFAEYLDGIIKDVFHSVESKRCDVKLKLAIDKVDLSIDRVLQCGLIINELVTNALKHAFSGRAKGCLQVSLTQMGSELTLSVRDDGIGLPQGFRLEELDSLGMKLIEAFVQDIEGEISFRSENGTLVEVRFPA